MVFGLGRRDAQDVAKAEGYDDEGENQHAHHHHGHHHEGQRQRERRAHRIISAVTALFTLATLVLFLLVGLGSPIIKVCVCTAPRVHRSRPMQGVWLLTLKAKPFNPSIVTSVASQIRFGTWGYCAVGYGSRFPPRPLSVVIQYAQ